jgi:hypothetical protein
VAPMPEIVEEIARKVCGKLAEANPLLAQSEIVFGFAAFLNILSRMQADHLNHITGLDESDPLDRDTQSD